MMRFLSSIKKELLELAHDRTMLVVLLVFPVFIMLFMGSSFQSMEINGLPVGVTGATNTTTSSVLFSDLNNSKAFNLQSYPTEDDAMTAFKDGQLRAVIVVPPDFDQSIAKGNGSSIKIIIDNSDLALEQSILSAMSSVIEASSANITRSYVTGAWQELRSLNDSATNLAGGINETRTAMENTKTSLTGIRQDIDNLSIDTLQNSMDSASNGVSGLQALVSAQKDALANFSSGNEAAFNQSDMFVYNATAALNQSIATIQDTHGKLAAQVQNLNNSVMELDASIAGLEALKNASSDNVTIAALGFNIMSLESLRNSTISQMNDAQSEMIELEGLNATLQSFGSELGDYSTQIQAAKASSDTSSMQIALDNASNVLSGLNSSFANADSEITKFRGVLADINSTTAQIEATLDAAIFQTSSFNSLIDSLHSTVAEQTGKDPQVIASPLTIDVESQYTRHSYVDFIMPQIIAVSLLLSCFLLGSISIVREKTGSTIIRALMSPGGLANLVIGKVITLVLLSFGQILVILVVALALFGVTPPTDIMMLVGGIAISSLVLSTIGIVIGFLAKSESAAIQGCLLIAIPMLFLGNIIFSPDLLPHYTQILQQLLPLSHVTSIFKIVLITNGNPAADITALMAYFILLMLLVGLFVFGRKDISNYQ